MLIDTMMSLFWFFIDLLKWFESVFESELVDWVRELCSCPWCSLLFGSKFEGFGYVDVLGFLCLLQGFFGGVQVR